MSTWAGLECWPDDSDPERADRERDAYEDSLLDEQPPDHYDTCPACYDAPEQESVCRCISARPEGGERDG